MIIVRILAWQLSRLRKKNNITVIAVAGSIGKTTTKLVIASILKKYCRVLVQEGNYNVDVTVPLVFFNQQNPPKVTNPLAWLRILVNNEAVILRDYPYDLVIVELGTDGPGQMIGFKKILNADIGVLTSIGHEHMEFFDSVDEVASEELIINEIANRLIMNQDDIPAKYRNHISNSITYGNSKSSHIQVMSKNMEVRLHSSFGDVVFRSQITGSHLQKTFGAALAVCILLGIDMDSKMKNVFESVHAVAGRMQLLPGIRNSVLIDDTYNNVSSEPAIAALNVLYEHPHKNKIAVLGNMNELGNFSKEMHVQVGNYCDASKLSEVITIGPHANTYLAEAARKNNNVVTSFDSPFEIAQYLKTKLDNNTVALFKGSQNKVYLEEAIKPLLLHPKDSTKLVRQSSTWLKKKQKNFESHG